MSKDIKVNIIILLGVIGIIASSISSLVIMHKIEESHHFLRQKQ